MSNVRNAIRITPSNHGHWLVDCEFILRTNTIRRPDVSTIVHYDNYEYEYILRIPGIGTILSCHAEKLGMV